MATDYGNGIVSRHGKLTFNGVDYRQLDANALYAMGRYMNTLDGNSFSDKKPGLFGSSIMSGRKNSPRDNWYEEQTKISHQLARMGINPAGLRKGGGYDTGRQISYERDRSIIGGASMSRPQANAAFASYLTSVAPQYQALQAAPQEGQPGVATGGTMASASRAYANLITRQRNLSQLGV